MRWLWSQFHFSCVLGYSGIPVVGDLVSDGAILHWLLLIMFLNLLFAIWLTLMLFILIVLHWSRPQWGGAVCPGFRDLEQAFWEEDLVGSQHGLDVGKGISPLNQVRAGFLGGRLDCGKGVGERADLLLWEEVWTGSTLHSFNPNAV